MNTAKKLISLLLALMMAVSALPLAATAAAIRSDVDTVEELISNSNLCYLADYLITQVNYQADIMIAPMLRALFLYKNNDDINDLIKTDFPGKDVTQLTGAEASKVFVTWLDAYVLPEKADELENNDAISIINNNVPGLQIKVRSVQDVFDTLAQFDSIGIHLALNLLGDVQDIDVSAVKNVKVAGNEYGAVKAMLRLLNDNRGIIEKLLRGTLDLGLMNDYMGDKLAVFTQFPLLIKSYIYKLIDKDAAAGEFAEGKMGGDWAESAYKDYTADQMLAAALIKKLTGDDGVVSMADADRALGLSFYGILAEYAKPVYGKYIVEPLNKAIGRMNDMLSLQTNAALKAQFKSAIPELTADTFSSVFDGAKDTGILGQLNNTLVIIAGHILSAETYAALKLEKGGNDKLNPNLTKIARYVVRLAQSDGEIAGMLQVPSDVLAADADTLELAEAAIYALKPFYKVLFGGSPAFSKTAVDSADSLADMAILAAYYTVTNTEWLQLDYDFTALKNRLFTNGVLRELTEVCDTVLEIGVEALIGALRNKYSSHFTAALSGNGWGDDLLNVENWMLDALGGLPAAARVHDLKNANGYGPFYKLNVLLNELFDFSFLTGVGDQTFTMDIETLVKNDVIENFLRFDIAGIVAVFEKNDHPGNVLNGRLSSSLIGVLNRMLTAVFEHDCGEHKIERETYDDPEHPCTHFIESSLEYCTVCGAYFSRSATKRTKTTPTHVYGEWETRTTATDEALITLTTCNYKTQRYRTCSVCGYEDKKAETTASHTWDDPASPDPRCIVCGWSVSELRSTCFTHTPGEEVMENYTAPTCVDEGGYDAVVYCTKCNEELSRTRITLLPTGEHTPSAPVPRNTVEPTCTKEGSCDMVVYCAVCKNELSRQTVTLGKTEHSPGPGCVENEDPATCTSKGSYEVAVYCTDCGTELSRETVTLQKAAHTPGTEKTENIVSSTCSREGSYDVVVYCAVCGDEVRRETRPLQKTAHTPGETKTENNVPPTCTARGSYDEVVYCAVCGEELRRTNKTVSPDPEAHKYSDAWGFKNENVHQKVCAYDPTHVITETHSWDEGTVIRPATAETEGLREYTCAVCGGKRTESIPRTAPTVKTPGDVNDDGDVTSADARLALRCAVSLESYQKGSREFLACDVNKDNDVTSADARLILRAAVGLEDLS